MVRLKNIKKNNDYMECNIIPEDSKKEGYVKVDIRTGNIEEYSLPDGYEYCMSHVSHARKALIEMSESEVIADEKLVMWY